MSDKLQGGIKADSTSVSWSFVLRSTTDSTEVTGKTATNFTGSYWRQGGTRTSISLSDLSTVNSAYSSGGVKEVDSTNMPGLYRLDLPDAAVASGADWVMVGIKCTGAFVFHERIPLTTNVIAAGDAYTRLGAPAGASTAADIAAVKAVLPAALVSGRIDASVGAMAAGTITAAAVATDAIDADAIAADAVNEIQSGLATSSALSTVSSNVSSILSAVDTEVAAIKAKTDSLTFTVANQLDTNIRSVNSTSVQGTGAPGNEWRP